MGQVQEVDGTPFWRTLRALPTLMRRPSAPYPSRSASRPTHRCPEAVQTGAYTAAIVFGWPPVFRQRSWGCRPDTRRQNVLMSTATAGAAGIGAWAEAASVELRLGWVRDGRTRATT
ncbi:MAG: hypothetical protein M3R38_22900 [Actinomycetota bacterium]|nr:hypothetical protein [Actinomycetota bacterium]